ncbi:MAG: aspartate aminotransferase family protein [Clostridia bacterium]|nr:aspartate aminotransferase family protein [Clostridia bacterium]
MNKKDLFTEMKDQLIEKTLFEQAKNAAYDYIDNLAEMAVSPSEASISGLKVFDGTMPEEPCPPSEVLNMLTSYGAANTIAQTGGKYFGFVCGGSLPVSLASKWLSDVWDQNSALFVLSPIAAKLEEICEKWIADLLGLFPDTAAGFVSGSSTAIICALAAARNELLQKQGWNVNEKGLFGAPPIRVVLSEQAHSSIFKALALLGLGKERVELVPADEEGRISTEKLPEIDSNTLLIIQAGNVNSGAFDPIDRLCDIGNKAGAWVHVDGAFGLWAAASENYRSLTKGMEKADSWSADAHKTLNAPYDCGIVLCKDRAALVQTMQASGSYIQYSENRDGMLYTPEMSRRARSIELWAVLKYLGKSGVESLVDRLCEGAKYFAANLSKNGFSVLNDVVFNQILIKCETPEITLAVLKNIQSGGKCWCGGAVWKTEPVIRISVCSWQTTEQDIDDCVEAFVLCRKQAAGIL